MCYHINMEEKTVDSNQNKPELMAEDTVNKKDQEKNHTTLIMILVSLVIAVISIVVIMLIIQYFIKKFIDKKDWVSRVGMGNPAYMQSWDECDSLSVGEMVKLSDKRDGELYVVRKQADGKCWMVENLSLDLTNQQVQSRINSSSTNASDRALAFLIRGGGTSEDQFAEEGVADWSSSNDYDSYSRPLIYTKLKDSTVETPTFIFPGTNERVGVYYNYCATSAGSYCYKDDMSRRKKLNTELDAAQSEIEEDICPKGWRLPTNSDFNELLNQESPNHRNVKLGNDTSAFIEAFHTSEAIGSCLYDYDDYYDKDSRAFHVDNYITYYWTSTLKSSNVREGASVYALNISLYNSASMGSSSVDRGFTIRCLHK